MTQTVRLCDLNNTRTGKIKFVDVTVTYSSTTVRASNGVQSEEGRSGYSRGNGKKEKADGGRAMREYSVREKRGGKRDESF